KEVKIKDIDLDKTVWIVKDVTKLFYEPTPESDYKYEIYFGLRLEVKRQRGDFYFVQIYNSILQEYRSGWVRTDDTGIYEYFYREYMKRKIEYDKNLANLDTEISEYEKFVKSMNYEIIQFEIKRTYLENQRNFRLQKIAGLKAEKRANEDEETRKRNDMIAELETKIFEFDSLYLNYDKEISKLEKDISKANSDIEKNSIKIAKLKTSIENIKTGKPDIPEIIAESELLDEFAEKEAIQIPDQGKNESDKNCNPIKDNLNSKMSDFENIRQKMSGQITKEEYGKLNEKYTETWTEIGQLKKELNDCETYSKTKHIALYNEALSLKKDEEYEDALKLLYEAVEIKKDFDEGYFLIVTILIILEDDKSVSNYIDKISSPEKKGKLYYKRALSVKDRYPNNAVIYLKAMAKLYKPELAFYLIGIVYSEKFSDFDNAIKYYKKSVELNYEDPKTLEALGAAYIELKPQKGQDKNININQAVSYLEKAYRNAKDYKNTDVLCARLSQAYNILGKSTSALKYADIALEKTKQGIFSFGHLEKAKALIKLEKIMEAKKHLNEAMKDISVKPEAEYWLKEIAK
ncbi:MAG: hypothetical protein KKD38_02465, partial [Candidatus Delongbacteria bacterium]|nr:hypothetical protein [Candidatus Delongbacteria bacterium]MCG2760750.1 hypothetical protein [Candidatus Delongbacteria bacterium]